MRSKDRNKLHDRDPALSFASRFFSFKLILLYVILLVVGYVALAVPIIVPLHLKNGEFPLSNYQMKEDNFDHPRLQLLRKREHLDQVVATGHSEFEKIILLRRWAHKQWEAGSQFYYPPWDAVEILDLARRGNRAFCAQYAIVFLQACQSMGLHARYVDLPGHFVAAVWSDDFDQWVVMDPTGDVHYERDGLPLSGRALSDAYWKDAFKGIFSVSSDGTRTPASKNDLAFYRGYSIDIEANQLSEPVTIIVNKQSKPHVRKNDYHEYPIVGRDSVGISSSFLAWNNPGIKTFSHGRQGSHDPDDFKYLKNQTIIILGRLKTQDGQVKVILKAENSETFERFLANLDNAGWQAVGAREILWGLRPGMNKLDVRIQTRYKWLGPISQATVYYKPAYISWPKKAA